MSDTHYAILYDHLKVSRKEGFAFLLCAHTYAQRQPVMLVRDLITIDDAETFFDGDGFGLSDRAVDEVLNKGAASDMALIEVHKHDFGPAGFSRTDRAGLLPFAQFVLESLSGRPYGAAVWADGEIYGEWFSLNDGRVASGPIQSFCVIGQSLRQLIGRETRKRISNRAERQLPLVGEEGQQTLQGLRFAIVGLGGIGSHVLQALCYLGAQNYLLIDGDVLEETNLNRVVFAKPSDVGNPKVEVARRFVESMLPQAHVEAVLEMVGSTDGPTLDLARCDVIFGCVDDDGPRLLLNREAISGCVPYFDLATGIILSETGPLVGGRIGTTLPNGPCLVCTEELDVEEVRSYFLSESDRQARVDHGYVQGKLDPAPSVVSLNGLIANTAITELALWLSKTKSPQTRIDLDVVGDTRFPGPRMMPRQGVRRNPGCPECSDQTLGRAA